MANPSFPARPVQRDGAVASQADWPAQAADTIERVVGTVRDKTTGPAITVARGVVFGLFALLVGSVVLVLALVALLRLIDVYLPESVWAAYLLLGVLLLIAAAFVWPRRKPREERSA